MKSLCEPSMNGQKDTKTISGSESIPYRIQKGESFTLHDVEELRITPSTKEYVELIKQHAELTNRIYKVLCLNNKQERKEK